MVKLGLLGGTFNPVHVAHLRIAEEVREACGLDRVLFIPAATPPHKELADDIPFADRHAMVAAAIADNPAFAVTDLESRRPGKSYSVRTLEILRREYPDAAFYFIIGMDSYRSLGIWKDFPRLFELTNLVVAARPGSPCEDPLGLLPVVIQGQFCYDKKACMLRHQSGHAVFFLKETFLAISSTHIRQLVAAEHSIRYLVPSAVKEYIYRHGLYRRRERS
jgi:nicotinate-nucleotide adenylyltransferase